MGGCFGKTAILGFAVTGPECLRVEVNNCNGGVLENRNGCTADVQLENIVIPPSNSTKLDLQQSNDGVNLYEMNSNMSGFIPGKDLKVKFQGSVGDQPFWIQFTNTGLLCK